METVRNRSALILEFLDVTPNATYEELARFLGVSIMTVRRDCDDLSRSGKVVKTVGGVQLMNGKLGFYEQTTYERIATNAVEKRAIARKTLELIPRPGAIFLDGSTTCLELAKVIDAERSRVTVVTYSTQVCLALRSGKNHVICFGGEFEPRSLCFVGPDTESTAKSVFIDTVFLSASGFVSEEGTFESTPAAFRIKQIVAQQATEVVLLVDHTKFGRRGLSKVLDISQIGRVVTNSGVSQQDLTSLRSAGVEVSIATIPRRGQPLAVGSL